MNRNLVFSSLMLACLVLPLVTVQFTLKDIETDPQSYMFEAQISEKLDETLNGHLQYFRVELLEGEAPASEFVVLIDRTYTRGYSNIKLELNQEFWGLGNLMTPEIYFGGQYLFFGLPQLHVWQIKGTIFWPDQGTELKLLYRAPIASLLAPMLVVFYPTVEEFTLSNYVAILAQTIVLAATIVLLIKNRQDKERIIEILLLYVFLTLIFTIPLLKDLY